MNDAHNQPYPMPARNSARIVSTKKERLNRELSLRRGDRFDRANDRRAFGEDLIRDLAPMDLDIAREFKGEPHPVALDSSNAHDADRIARITDDDLFAFTSRDDKHCSDLLSSRQRTTRTSPTANQTTSLCAPVKPAIHNLAGFFPLTSSM